MENSSIHLFANSLNMPTHFRFLKISKERIDVRSKSKRSVSYFPVANASWVYSELCSHFIILLAHKAKIGHAYTITQSYDVNAKYKMNIVQCLPHIQHFPEVFKYRDLDAFTNLCTSVLLSCSSFGNL